MTKINRFKLSFTTISLFVSNDQVTFHPPHHADTRVVSQRVVSQRVVSLRQFWSDCIRFSPGKGLGGLAGLGTGAWVSGKAPGGGVGSEPTIIFSSVIGDVAPGSQVLLTR